MELNVLSLFDGISCGRIALERAGIKVKKYYASEISKDAISVSKSNWDNIVYLGDVTKWTEWDIDWSSIDLLIGGSPCTSLSIAGDMTGIDGDGESNLFYEYYNILQHIRKSNPNVNFLLENVIMAKNEKAKISNFMGCDPIMINSSLVSAQNRKRLYWANWNITIPHDKGLSFQDIPTNGMVIGNKAHCLTHLFGNCRDFFKKGHTNIVFELLDEDIRGHSVINTSDMDSSKVIVDGTISMVFKKSKTPDKVLTFKIRLPNGVYHLRGLDKYEIEKLQTLPEGYLSTLTDPKAQILGGYGWTVDVIAHILSELK